VSVMGTHPVTSPEWITWYEQFIDTELSVEEAVTSFQVTADRVGARYDDSSVGEFAESLLVLRTVVDTAAELRQAASVALERMLVHNELLGGVVKAGVEDDSDDTGEAQEIKRQWFLLTVHESGHAVYSTFSEYWRPVVMADLEIHGGGWFQEPGCSGYVDNALRRKTNRITRAIENDFAALALAGSVAQAFWMNYMEDTDYTKALKDCYRNGGSYDYWNAFGWVWRSKRRLRYAQEMAEELVADKFPNILRMAEEAREKEQLSDTEMTAYKDDDWGAK
jgi:hypothetical protein